MVKEKRLVYFCPPSHTATPRIVIQKSTSLASERLTPCLEKFRLLLINTSGRMWRQFVPCASLAGANDGGAKEIHQL